MQIKIVLFIILFFTQSTFYGFNDADIAARSVISFCDIHNTQGKKIITFPGSLCAYKDDGSVVYTSSEKLSMVNSQDSVLWEKKGFFHHQIKWSSNKKNILAIDSDFYEMNKKKYRTDVLVIYNEDGTLNKKILATDMIKQVEKGFHIQDGRWFYSAKFNETAGEVSHINSFYEIPQHSNTTKIKQIPPGGYVVNGLYDGIFILDSDLKKVLYHFKFPFTVDNLIHDVQVTNRGTFLMFVNVFNPTPGKPSGYPYSAAVEYDPFTNKILWKFTAVPHEIFYSPATGGVQELDENTVLISVFVKGFFIINKKDNSMLFPYNVYRNIENSFGITSYQDIKLYNMESFFKKRKIKNTN